MLFSARSAASIWKRGSSVEVGAFSARVTDIRNSSGPYFAHSDAATLDGARYDLISILGKCVTLVTYVRS